MTTLALQKKLKSIDQYQKQIYEMCKQESFSYKEVKSALNVTIFKAKTYVNYLEKNGYLKIVGGRKENRGTQSYRFIATSKEYNVRTDDEIKEHIVSTYTDKMQNTIKGKYDDIIASNPNLRVIKLFDTKPAADFTVKRKQGSRGISSSWTMFDSF